ncbi:hypothetical protein SNE40_008084 [Patella caerulea]|uniref:Diphosphomevalonate decarboxylase n=1 Tax=Patella caerulea TaxID=87958 RepID=A0AAN8JUZ9_PATCE
MKTVTCTAPVNIAVIKYWGKRDENLILPVNSSLSATLGQNELRAKTTVAVDPSFTEDKMWLNDKEQSVNTQRIQNVFREIRRRARKRKGDGDKSKIFSQKIHICSENNFPTAAGLASSAAGYACLVYSLAKLFDVDGEISDIARQGSGSACRSIYGGFVEWQMGTKADGSDSFAKQITPAQHWPEMCILILVVSDQKKHTGSTEGMQTSVQNSRLLEKRIEVVPERMTNITKAIKEKDFHTFAEITMKDSNQFHAICLDTYPPISYMTDVSRQIVRFVHSFNNHSGETKVAYTFDAGPNACLYLLEKDLGRVISLVNHFFPAQDNGLNLKVQGLPVSIDKPSQKDIDALSLPVLPNSIKYLINTKVGEGPQILSDPSESLLTDNGHPKTLSS